LLVVFLFTFALSPSSTTHVCSPDGSLSLPGSFKQVL
jgi:hypothetical protein